MNLPPANPVLLAGEINCLQTSTTLTAGATGATAFTLLNTGQTNSTGSFTVNSAGQYTVRIGNVNGCVSTATNTVINNTSLLPTVVLTFPNGSSVVVNGPVPTISLQSGNTIAQQSGGPDLGLVVSGGVQYEWYLVIDRINGYEIRQADTNTTGYFRFNQAGSYRITVTGANGCKRTVEGFIASKL